MARVRAFAKINRSLHVLGTRPDGFHELRTVFQSIALHDTITIRAVEGPLRLTCDDPDCPCDETNLIWRAAEHVWKAAGRRGAPRDLTMQLSKRIPMQAGLGGGSSDAAAALRAFGRLWRVDAARVRAIAPSLGADVPYFFEGGTVLGLERGDVLFPLVDAARAWVVLAVPSFGVNTKDAFAWWDRRPRAGSGRGAGLGPHMRVGLPRRRLGRGRRRLAAGATAADHENSGSRDLSDTCSLVSPSYTLTVCATWITYGSHQPPVISRQSHFEESPATGLRPARLTAMTDHW